MSIEGGIDQASVFLPFIRRKSDQSISHQRHDILVRWIPIDALWGIQYGLHLFWVRRQDVQIQAHPYPGRMIVKIAVVHQKFQEF